MTSALERGEGSASRRGRTLPLGKTRYPFYMRLGGPQGRSGEVRKIPPPPGFDPRTVQPVGTRCTDYATRDASIFRSQFGDQKPNTHLQKKNFKCYKFIFGTTQIGMPVTVAARSKAWDCCPLLTGVLCSRLQTATIPDAVRIQFVLLKMGMLMLEICRG